MITKDPTTP